MLTAKKCDACGGTGEHLFREDATSTHFPHLRPGLVDAYIDDPPSESIASLLSSIDLLITRAASIRGATSTRRVCLHGINPCISRCGVQHTHDGWEVIPRAEREEWYRNVFTYGPYREDWEQELRDRRRAAAEGRR